MGRTGPGLVTLTARADFVRASRGLRAAAPGLHLQALPREGTGVRVGFTASRKVGGAVQRNRAKRRLRAAAREVLAAEGRAGWDYVLVGRPAATDARAWPDLLDDLRRGLARVHAQADAAAPEAAA